MKKQIVAIDIDDVLSDESEAVRAFINKTYGTNHTAKDYLIRAPYWGFWERVWGVDEKEGKIRHEAYITSGVKASLKVIPGAIPIIKALKKHYDLVVVTSRDKRLSDLTERWLEKHFPTTFKSIEFVHVWSDDNQSSKAIICKSIGASYLIDDNLEHCTLVAQEGITSLLFGEYGWNKSEHLPRNVLRVKNWQEIGAYFGV